MFFIFGPFTSSNTIRICFPLFSEYSFLDFEKDTLVFNEIFQISVELEFSLMDEIYLFCGIVLLVEEFASAQVYLLQFVHDCVREFLFPVFEEL